MSATARPPPGSRPTGGGWANAASSRAARSHSAGVMAADPFVLGDETFEDFTADLVTDGVDDVGEAVAAARADGPRRQVQAAPVAVAGGEFVVLAAAGAAVGEGAAGHAEQDRAVLAADQLAAVHR